VSSSNTANNSLPSDLRFITSFGYDTGQISGFLEMPNFLERFGQKKADGTPYFSDVRSGLIVALV
jgi:hypothetical protein